MADSEDIFLSADIQFLKNSEYSNSNSKLDITTVSKYNIMKYTEACI